jgi:gamma-glutamylputrescine oxidase
MRLSLVVDKVVLATGAEFMRPKGIGYDLLPRNFIRAQTIIHVTDPISPELASQIVPGTACFADTRETAMNYGRVIPAEDGSDNVRIAFGGADALAQMQTAIAAFEIRDSLYTMFPQLRENGVKLHSTWGGTCDLSGSALPRLWEPQPGMVEMSGFSGQGLILTATLGRAAAEKISTGASDAFETLAALTQDDPPMSRFELLAKAGIGYTTMVKPHVDRLMEKIRPSALQAN